MAIYLWRGSYRVVVLLLQQLKVISLCPYNNNPRTQEAKNKQTDTT